MIDVPTLLVSTAARLLPPGRVEWSRAMAAELANIRETSARWRFSIGCLRSAIVAPPLRGIPGSHGLGILVALVFLAGIAGCIAATSYVLRTWPHAINDVPASTALQFAAALTFYFWLAVRPPRAVTAHISAARRGIVAGLALFAFITVVSPALDAILRTDDPDTLVLILEMPAVLITFTALGYSATRDDESMGAGLTAALWAGLVCSILAFNADLITLLGRFDLEGHLQGIQGNRSASLPDPDAFLSKHVGDHLASSMLGLRMLPLLALFLGAIGSGVARFRSRPVGRVIVVN